VVPAALAHLVALELGREPKVEEAQLAALRSPRRDLEADLRCVPVVEFRGARPKLVELEKLEPTP